LIQQLENIDISINVIGGPYSTYDNAIIAINSLSQIFNIEQITNTEFKINE
jgi:hypothetical protein